EHRHMSKSTRAHTEQQAEQVEQQTQDSSPAHEQQSSGNTWTPEALRAAWQECVASGALGVGVLGVQQLRVMGRAGDEASALPRVTSLAVLDENPVARWAVAEAERIVRAKQSQPGTHVMVVPRQTDRGALPQARPLGPDEPLDPLADVDYLVMSRVIGG